MDFMKFQLMHHRGSPDNFKTYPVKATRKSRSPQKISPTRLQKIRPRSSSKRDTPEAPALPQYRSKSPSPLKYVEADFPREKTDILRAAPIDIAQRHHSYQGTGDIPEVDPLPPYRSKTPSPQRCLQGDAPRKNTDILRDTPNNIEQRLYSFQEARSKQTYFSSRPPVVPMRIVLLGEPPEYCSSGRGKFLLEKQRKSERTLSLHQRNQHTDIDKVVTAFSSPARREKHARFRQFVCPTTKHAADIRRANNAVVLRTWVHQLVNNLPLEPAIPTSTSDVISDEVLEECDSVCSEQLPATRNITPALSPESPSRCSISVQVLSTRCSSSITNAPADHRGMLPEEWVGGVRALRDSHVRLVLRQLKHIERLNRALDNVATRKPTGKRPKTSC